MPHHCWHLITMKLKLICLVCYPSVRLCNTCWHHHIEIRPSCHGILGLKPTTIFASRAAVTSCIGYVTNSHALINHLIIFLIYLFIRWRAKKSRINFVCGSSLTAYIFCAYFTPNLAPFVCHVNACVHGLTFYNWWVTRQSLISNLFSFAESYLCAL